MARHNNKLLDAPTIKDAARTAARTATPITDHRGGMEYRSRMVEVLVDRALRRCQAALSIGAAA